MTAPMMDELLAAHRDGILSERHRLRSIITAARDSRLSDLPSPGWGCIDHREHRAEAAVAVLDDLLHELEDDR